MRAIGTFSQGQLPNLGGLAKAAILAGRQVVLRLVADRYRPEKHYMRGPGPKARAKQQAAFRAANN